MLYIVGYWHLFDYTKAFPEWKNSITYGICLIVLGLFVVISGFLVGYSTKKSISLIHFFKTRFIRIYLLYALAVAIFYLYGINGGTTSLKSMFFIPMVFGPAPLTLWFINMLVLFYLATPFLFKLAENPGNYFWFILAVLLIMFTLLATTTTIDKRVFLYFPCFCIGVYCSQHGLNTRVVNSRTASMVLGLWLIFLITGIDSWTLQILKQLLMILSCSYLMFSLSYFNEEKFKNLGIVSVISYSSFAMYLFHRPIYMSVKAFYFPESGKFQILYLLTVCLTLVIFISWTLQKLYDVAYVTCTKSH